MDIKHPEVEVELVGTDSNAFAILGRVCAAMKRAGVSKEEINAFMREAETSGSYDSMLQTVLRWVSVS
jgi:hypothetical protein